MKLENVIVLLFLLKPLIDLSWNKPLLVIAGKNISFLHLTGAAIFLYFGLYVLKLRGKVPLSRWMLLFLSLNLCSFLYAYYQGMTSDFVRFIDLMLRMADSFIIYHITFLSRRIHRSEWYFRFLRAVVLGTAIAVGINGILIFLDQSGLQASQEVLRMSGLYHDPGVLSNLALYNFIFASIILQLRMKNGWIKIILVLMMCIDLYLMYCGLSRTVIIQLFCYVIIYATFVTKGIKRLRLIGLLLVVSLSVIFSGVDFDRFERRFATELAVISLRNEDNISSDDRFSLQAYERLGTNRFKMWLFSLEEIRERDTYEILFGNFKSTAAHSDYIDVLSRNGAVGLGVYLFILFSLWKRSLRLFIRMKDRSGEDRIIHALAFAFISLYILYGFPFRPLSYTTTAWYMWATLGLSFGRVYWMGRNEDSQNIDSYSPEKCQSLRR